MKSKIGIIRGASEKKVKSKKFNIYLGISLHNKWFTKNNMKESILWGLKHTKKRFGLVIADTLQAINYENKDISNGWCRIPWFSTSAYAIAIWICGIGN